MATDDTLDDDFLIQKKIVHAGSGNFLEMPDDTKVSFHFRTQKEDEGETVLDDSRELGKPMELIIGKKFKLEVWEKCIKTMCVDEVAVFSVDKSLLTSYPWVSKTVRKALSTNKTKHGDEHPHCCGMMAFQGEGMGHQDLDELLRNPVRLKFTIELLKVERPGDYTQEAWAMSDAAKLNSVPHLREEGNSLYKNGCYPEAADKYAEALGRLEHLVLREKPGDEEWLKLDRMKIPLLLNFSQCKLLLKDYYPVIEHTTTVLEKEPDNVKALFRRAKAHVGAWNPDDARKDFHRVAELDPQLAPSVKSELQNLDTMQRQRDLQDANLLKGKLF